MLSNSFPLLLLKKKASLCSLLRSAFDMEKRIKCKWFLAKREGRGEMTYEGVHGCHNIKALVSCILVGYAPTRKILPTPSTSIKAPPSADVLALHQLLPRHGLGSADTNWEERLQHLLIPGTRAIYPVTTVQLWVWPPDCKTHHHPLPQFLSCKACPQGRSGLPTRLQTARHDLDRPQEGHQMGD